MAYCTGFTLDVHEGDLDIKTILESPEAEGFEGLDYAIGTDGDRLDDVKWYYHEEDMKDLSLKFPEIVFVLRGEGEDNDDTWYKYFKNGKMQSCYAVITFDEYDESKLR